VVSAMHANMARHCILYHSCLSVYQAAQAPSSALLLLNRYVVEGSARFSLCYTGGLLQALPLWPVAVSVLCSAACLLSCCRLMLATCSGVLPWSWYWQFSRSADLLHASLGQLYSSPALVHAYARVQALMLTMFMCCLLSLSCRQMPTSCT
jgi:hypothetical protein